MSICTKLVKKKISYSIDKVDNIDHLRAIGVGRQQGHPEDCPTLTLQFYYDCGEVLDRIAQYCYYVDRHYPCYENR